MHRKAEVPPDRSTKPGRAHRLAGREASRRRRARGRSARRRAAGGRDRQEVPEAVRDAARHGGEKPLGGGRAAARGGRAEGARAVAAAVRRQTDGARRVHRTRGRAGGGGLAECGALCDAPAGFSLESWGNKCRLRLLWCFNGRFAVFLLTAFVLSVFFGFSFCTVWCNSKGYKSLCQCFLSLIVIFCRI